MTSYIFDAIFIAIYAILYSALEIEIEAGAGWAKNLPTVPVFGTRFTGYHVLMNITVIMSLCYALMPSKGLFYILYFIIAWFLIEDFCWFVLNPSFGLTKYKKENISWHGDNWPGGIPIHNYIGVALMIASAYMSGNNSLIISGAIMATFVAITIAITPHYHTIYKEVRDK